MPRPRCRATLEAGLRLDINSLVRSGLIPPLAHKSIASMRWTDSYSGEETASIEITCQLETDRLGFCDINLDGRAQRIFIVARERHFGGVQWYFICPYMNQRASVLWMPPGASTFACRQEWGRRVAYASQFCDRDGRAHQGQAKIRGKLCKIGGFEPEKWEFPPKPKGMRWRTYQRAEAKFDRYEAILNEGIEELAERLGWLK